MTTALCLTKTTKMLATISVISVAFVTILRAAETPKQEAEPRVIDPGPIGGPPSDAVVLFDGKDLSRFRGERSAEPQWKLEDGVMETTPHGGIFSKDEFGDCQLHAEWASPSVVKGEGQGRGNSGVYRVSYRLQEAWCSGGC